MSRIVRLGGPHLHHLEHEDCKGDSCHACYRGQDHTLGKDLAHDVPWLGTDGPADAYLRGALLHCDHHDVAHTDGTSQECTESHHPTQYLDTLEEAVHHAEQGFRIHVQDGLLVLRMYQMGLLQYRLDALLDVLDGMSGAGGVAQQLDFVSEVEVLLHGAERDGDGGGWPTVYTHVAC